MPSDSNWKRPLVLAGGEELVGRGVVERDLGRVDADARCASIIFTQLSMSVSVRRPRKSIFRSPIRSTPFMSNCVVIVAGRALEERHEVDERLRRDHDAGGVGRRVARRALEPPRDVDELLDLRVLLVGVLERRRLLERLVERHLEVERDHLRDLVDLGVAHVQHAPDVAHDGLRLHRPERDDLRHVVAAVLPRDVLDDLSPARLAEVDVDVGELMRSAFRKRSKRRSYSIGSMSVMRSAHATRLPAAEPRPGPTGIRLLLRVADEVPDDEEVAREADAADDADLLVEPRLVVGERVPQAPGGGAAGRASGAARRSRRAPPSRSSSRSCSRRARRTRAATRRPSA